MAYDEKLAERLRGVLRGHQPLQEKKMFGGLCFMLGGHMVCGIAKEELMVRVGPEQYEQALARKHAKEMDFTGRPLKGMIYVEREGLGTEKALREWVELGVAFTTSLPPKVAKPKRRLA